MPPTEQNKQPEVNKHKYHPRRKSTSTTPRKEKHEQSQEIWDKTDKILLKTKPTDR